MKKILSKKALLSLILEFISVVFAVLLALGLNSYKQTQDLKAESKTLTLKILTECRRNMTELDSVNMQNRDYLQYLDSLIAIKDQVKGFRIDFSSELLTSSSWRYTQISPAFNYMDNDFLNAATITYELQEYYMQISSKMVQNIGEMILSSDGVEPATLLETCHYYTRNIHYAGEQLQETYGDFLNNHDSQKE